MSSVSPDPLIGVDPNDTEEVSYGGATFVLGTLPAGLWEELGMVFQLARQEAQARQIAELRRKGLDPEEIEPGFEASGISRLDVAISSEPQFQREVNAVYLKAVQFGLRGHRNFNNRKGNAFEFNLNDDGSVSEGTLKVYAVNPALTRTLWSSFRSLNDLGALAKKV